MSRNRSVEPKQANPAHAKRKMPTKLKTCNFAFSPTLPWIHFGQSTTQFPCRALTKYTNYACRKKIEAKKYRKGQQSTSRSLYEQLRLHRLTLRQCKTVQKRCKCSAKLVQNSRAVYNKVQSKSGWASHVSLSPPVIGPPSPLNPVNLLFPKIWRTNCIQQRRTATSGAYRQGRPGSINLPCKF